MHPASTKSSMSFGELAICEDCLDSHREYAFDLSSSLDKIRQWHKTDSCPEVRESGTCTVCELCSTNGLLGAARKALASYNDAGKYLQEVRASLGKRFPSHGLPRPETLFKNNSAKVVCLSVIAAGDTLRSQHATWHARLQSELSASTSSDKSPKHVKAGPGDLNKNGDGDILFPIYSGLKFVGPEANPQLTAVPPGWVPETVETISGSSTVVVFRRCLSNDCPCEANRASAASNANLGGAFVSQISSKALRSPSDSEKTRTARVNAKPGPGAASHAKRSIITSLEHGSRGTGDTTETLPKARTNAQINKSCTYHDLNSPGARALDAQRLQNAVPGEHDPSNPCSETALTQPSSSPESIVDPRIFRLRAQIMRSDDACRAFIDWCRTWTADLQSTPREKYGIGSRGWLTLESTTKAVRGYPSASARDLEIIETGKSLCMTGQIGGAATNDLSLGDDEIMTVELPFNSQQEKLKDRWLIAREKRCKDRKRRPALVLSSA